VDSMSAVFIILGVIVRSKHATACHWFEAFFLDLDASVPQS